MNFSIPKTNYSEEIIPNGTHVAYCYGVVDMGTQEGSYQGKVTNSRKIKLFFEFPDVKIKIDGEDKPMVKQAEYTFSQAGNFGKMLNSWIVDMHEDFQLTSLIGMPAMVTIIHKEREGSKYAVIQSVVAAPSSLVGVDYKMYNESIILNLGDYDSIESDLPKLEKYKWTYEKVTSSPEYIKYLDVKEKF